MLVRAIEALTKDMETSMSKIRKLEKDITAGYGDVILRMLEEELD